MMAPSIGGLYHNGNHDYAMWIVAITLIVYGLYKVCLVTVFEQVD